MVVLEPDNAALMVVASKSHRDQATDDYISRYAVRDMTSAGSSLKFCLLATGEADLYPRLGTTSQWDIAAGPRVDSFDAVVHSAALADDWAPRGDAMRTNEVGTRNVVASFPGARIVHLSTSSVYDAFTPSVRVSESAAPVEHFLSTYSESKTAAEAAPVASMSQGMGPVLSRATRKPSMTPTIG